MSDKQLIGKAQDGDGRALEELCRREWQPIYALLYATLRDRAETEDVTQEVFLRALRSFDHYRHRDIPFRAYLATIAKNLLRDRWRRSSPTLVDIAEYAEPAADEPSPDERLLDAERKRSIHALLDSLGADQREVIRLRVLEGRSADEVASILDRTPNAVRQLQHRAINTLRQRMQEGSQV